MSKIRQPSSHDELLLSAKNLNVDLLGKTILKGIDIELARNDFITIIGPNGAGKSTLLKVLLKILPKTSGELYLQPGIKVAYVPQQMKIPVTLPLTVDGFLSLNSKHVNQNMNQVIDQLDIAACRYTLMHELSGGQKQRVLIARALLQEPDLLVLDEPAQNLDVKGQLALYQFLDNLYVNKKISILMVSHDLHMVMSITTHVVCLFNEICCSGKPKDIAKDPAFTNIFGAEMASMMSYYHHNHGGDHE